MRNLLCVGFICLASSAVSHETLEGPYPLLVTPWTEQATMDAPVLVREAEYVEAAGVGGIIWPSASEVEDLDEEGEYELGIRALARRFAEKGRTFSARLVATCPGDSSASALRRVKIVQKIADETGARMGILARPPADAADQDDMVAHYRGVAQATTLPVIIQTFNGTSPQPSVDVLVALAREFPRVYGYVKEESPGEQVNARMEELVSHPEIKAVFSGWGGKGWVYQGSRIGTRGVITQRAAYAPLLAKVWKRLKAGKDARDRELSDAFVKYLYMANLGDVYCEKGDDMMRGPHLYVLERLGIFKNRLTRVPYERSMWETVAGAFGAKIPRWSLEDYPMSDAMKKEVEARMAYCGLLREGR